MSPTDANAEVLLDHGYYRNRGWQKKNERREVERREEINSRTYREAEIGPQSLHGLQTIAVGIASLCTLFLPSVLLFCTFSVLHSSFFLSFILFPFTLSLTISNHLLRFHSYSPCYIFKSVASFVSRKNKENEYRINIK